MTGPPYPRYAPGAAPGSNEIGGFVVGSSPVGDITVFDPWATIISQYANSPILTSIITAFAAAIDPTLNFDNFFDLIWNVFTASGYGLDVWGRIVGIGRTFPVAVVSTPTFGFQESGNDWVGFNQAPFFSGSSPTNNVTLIDSQYRPVVLAKAMTNLWNGSIAGFNAILLGLYAGLDTPHVIDNGNMSITLKFNIPLTPLQIAVLASNVVPQPTGVVINLSHP